MEASWMTRSGNLIEGWVKPKIIQNSILYVKLPGEAKKFRLSADSVEFVVSKGQKIFKTQEILFNGRKDQIFCILILQGAANLYTGKHEDLGKLYFIEINDKMLVVPKSGLGEYYKTLFNECFDVNICRNCPYTESSLKKVIKRYSECRNPEIQVNDNPLNIFRTNYAIGAKTSYNTGGFVFPENARYGDGDYSNFSDLSIGIVGRANITKNIFIQTEFSILRKESEADPVVTGQFENTGIIGVEPVDITSKVKFDLTYLDWPVYVGYCFLKGNVKPFLGIGINMDFLLSGEIIDEPYIKYLGKGGSPYYKFNNLDFGLSGLIGADIQISQRSTIQLYLKYVRSTSDYMLYSNSVIIGGDGMGSSNLDTNRFEFSLVYVYCLSKISK
jgi:hypothetical protein